MSEYYHGAGAWRYTGPRKYSSRPQKRIRILRPWKDKSKRTIHPIRKKAEKKCILAVNTVETHMRSGGVQHITGAVQDLGNSANLSGYARTRTGRCQMMKKDKEQLMGMP